MQSCRQMRGFGGRLDKATGVFTCAESLGGIASRENAEDSVQDVSRALRATL